MFKRASIEALFFIMKGKILISSPSLLSDSIFYKSIILIVDETDNSHIGFILNRPGGLFLMNDSDNSFFLETLILSLLKKAPLFFSA